MPPASGVRGRGTQPGSSAGVRSSSVWGQCPPLLSRSSGPGGPLLPPSPDLPHPGLPPMPPGSTRPRGGFGGWGTWPGSSAGFLGLSGRGKCPQLLSCSSGPGGPLLPASPDLPPTSLLCPQDQHGPEGTSEGVGPGLRAGQTSLVNWAGERLGLLPLIPAPEGPTRSGNPSPLSVTPQGCRSCPAFTSPPPSVPPHPTGSLGGSYPLLGH